MALSEYNMDTRSGNNYDKHIYIRVICPGISLFILSLDLNNTITMLLLIQLSFLVRCIYHARMHYKHVGWCSFLSFLCYSRVPFVWNILFQKGLCKSTANFILLLYKSIIIVLIVKGNDGSHIFWLEVLWK